MQIRREIGSWVVTMVTVLKCVRARAKIVLTSFCGNYVVFTHSVRATFYFGCNSVVMDIC